MKLSHENNFDISFRVILPLSWETGLCLVLWWEIQIHNLLVSILSTEMQLTLQILLTDIRKPIRNACLGIVKHDWILIVWQWTDRKQFLFTRGNIWNSKEAFYNKTTCLLKYGCFNRDIPVVTLIEFGIPKLSHTKAILSSSEFALL